MALIPSISSFINNQPIDNKTPVYYNNQQVPLPQDVIPNQALQEIGNQTVTYNNQTVNIIQIYPAVADPTNNPSFIQIGNVILPATTLIMVNNSKIIARSQIIDGVEVYEHIARKACDIQLDFVITEGAVKGNAMYTSSGNNTASISPDTDTSFPQQQLNLLWQSIWNPNSEQTIINSYLNGLGIGKIIIESINPATVRGSKNIPVTIKALESIPSNSLILNSNPT
jgi:hypothetical protein